MLIDRSASDNSHAFGQDRPVRSTLGLWFRLWDGSAVGFQLFDKIMIMAERKGSVTLLSRA
jgi:hypothetical protein